MAEIVEEFTKAPKALRLPLLLDHSKKLVTKDHLSASMAQVHECQSPFFVTVQRSAQGLVLEFDVPAEAPTVRGYAHILQQGLRGTSPEQVGELPDTFYLDMGLGELITPLRLRGMGAIVREIKRQAASLIGPAS